MLSESSILKKIERQPKRTAGYKQLVRELGVRGDNRRRFTELLDRLVSSGQLVKVDFDRYAIPQAASNRNMIVGRLSMHRDGFVFVIPDPKSLVEPRVICLLPNNTSFTAYSTLDFDGST